MVSSKVLFEILFGSKTSGLWRDKLPPFSCIPVPSYPALSGICVAAGFEDACCGSGFRECAGFDFADAAAESAGPGNRDNSAAYKARR